MARDFLRLLLAFPIPLLWAIYSSRLLIRLTGTRVSWIPLKLMKVNLTDFQNFQIGVFSFGVAESDPEIGTSETLNDPEGEIGTEVVATEEES